MQITYTPEEDTFVDARDSWNDNKTELDISKTKEEVGERILSGGKKAKVVLLVPRNVVDKLTFPIENTPARHIRVFGNNYSLQETTDLSSLDMTFKKSLSLSSNEIHAKFENNVKSCTIEKSSLNISVKKTKSQEITTKKVEMKRTKKRASEFDNLYLLQEIKTGDGSIWTSQFSPDGTLFATGGADHILRIYELNDSQQQCNSFLNLIADSLFFNSKPIQEYSEHTADILDLSWSTKVR
jgi:WD40 repeat protein